MANHSCPPDVAVSIAARLVRANVPFSLTAHNRTEASVECMNQETLDIAIKQVKAERIEDFTGIERRLLARDAIPETATTDQGPLVDAYLGTRTGRIVPEFNPPLHKFPSFNDVFPPFPRQGNPSYDSNIPGFRSAATVGDTPACGMTDTEFDSDPSVVNE